MKPWYEQSFGKDYMIVYKHRDWEQADREVAKMAAWLDLPNRAKVLDIGCGMGRHAVALAACGYQVTGVDLSDTLLAEAKENDDEKEIEWMHGDMRSLPFEDGSFDATLNLFTSFGYFSAESDNIAVMRQIRRVLKPNGLFLIDFLNPDYIVQHLIPYSERFEPEHGVHIEEARSIRDGWVQKEITVYEPGKRDKARQYLERVRLYSLDWFEQQFKHLDLRLEQLYGDYEGSAYKGGSSKRMIMVGKSC